MCVERWNKETKVSRSQRGSLGPKGSKVVGVLPQVCGNARQQKYQYISVAPAPNVSGLSG